jgi:flagellar protein FlaG
MINNVVNFPQIPDPTYVRPVKTDAPKEVTAAEASGKSKDAGDQSDLGGGGHNAKEPIPDYQLRLTVDRDPKSGEWIYRAIDRSTGEVVKQLPRQELLDMRNSGSYQAGSVIKTDV